MLSDIFGTNGRRVLDGVVSRLDILASLSWHVRRKLDQLVDALNLTLRETERRLLADLLTEHDAIRQRIGNFDRHIDEDLAPYPEQRRLLETLSGVDRTAACAILSEIGADPHKVFGNPHRLAAWAGLCPGNNESAGKRRKRATLAAATRPCARCSSRAPTPPPAPTTASSRASDGIASQHTDNKPLAPTPERRVHHPIARADLERSALYVPSQDERGSSDQGR